MRRLLGWVCVVVFLACVAIAVNVQAQGQQPPPTFEQATERAWTGVHTKILNMLKDYPEDKYKTKPGDDTRDFVAEIRHVMVGMDMTASMLKGEQGNFQERNAYYDGRPGTRDSLVADYETSMNACLAALKASPNPRVVGWIEHAGEHYGKLVGMYRMNGLVPPQTRAQQERQRQQQQGKQPGKN